MSATASNQSKFASSPRPAHWRLLSEDELHQLAEQMAAESTLEIEREVARYRAELQAAHAKRALYALQAARQFDPTERTEDLARRLGCSNVTARKRLHRAFDGVARLELQGANGKAPRRSPCNLNKIK